MTENTWLILISAEIEQVDFVVSDYPITHPNEKVGTHHTFVFRGCGPPLFPGEQNHPSRRLLNQVNRVNCLSIRDIGLSVKKHDAACPCTELRLQCLW